MIAAAIGLASGAPQAQADPKPAASAAADEWRTRVQPTPWSQAWSGVGLAGDVRSLWGGLAFAPFGSLLEPGWRLRLAGSASRFHYLGPRYRQQPARCGDHGAGMQRIDGESTHGEVLVGHQLQWGRTTIKVFAGVAAREQRIAPDDPCNDTLGLRFGAKATVEIWQDIGAAGWLAFDAGAAHVDWLHSARLRLGHTVVRAGDGRLDLGLDLAVGGDQGHRWHRGGLLARWAGRGSEFELSTGIIAAYDDSLARYGTPAPYVMLNWVGDY
jgi:hypothetical protein